MTKLEGRMTDPARLGDAELELCIENTRECLTQNLTVDALKFDLVVFELRSRIEDLQTEMASREEEWEASAIADAERDES